MIESLLTRPASQAPDRVRFTGRALLLTTNPALLPDYFASLMIVSLLTRPVSKAPDRVRFDGRVLFLTEDPGLLRRQLAGEDLPFDPAAPAGSALNPRLRDNISTDEITPAYI